MAQSNRERVGQMFDVLAPALNTFLTNSLASGLPTGASSWTVIVAAVDNTNGTGLRDHNPDDPHLQLKVLSQGYPGRYKRGWAPFRGLLTRVHEAYAGELLDHRNAWAHLKPFSDDDAYRALDTAERLLAAVGAQGAADQVSKIRLNLRRVTADKDDKRTLKSAVALPESTGLRPWREVLRPHDDVATGNFRASEFAADLYKVATGDPDQGKDYADPTTFFSRTYLTEGLRDLISGAVRRLSRDNNAAPVINLQTNFGGGKTHSMLSLWHVAAGQAVDSFPQDVQELLSANGYDDLPARIHRVAIVGNHFAPSGETKPDGTRVHTLWGELAWQLGGAAAYASVAEADTAGTAPGSALHELLLAHSPAVILIDEWVAYARQLYDRDAAGGTFDTQFTFAQSLTEAVKGTPGVLLAISIPASYDADDLSVPVAGSAEEVGGAHGVEALKRLQNVVRRVADQWRPASPDEAYHIVRQRLFVTPDAAALASISQTARGFVDYYRKQSADFPRETTDTEYEDRIRHTYPIHPELFDRLYEDWSSLDRFQRTRGVLRLMNVVIRALWDGQDASPLIMPGSIPLASSTVSAELTQYLHDSWRSILDADVDGSHSEPARIDTENPLYGQRSLTKRLARTVFFGSAPTLGAAHKGIETQRVFLGAAVPGDIPGNFHSALNKLADRATHFYAGSGKYWFDLQANISRRAKDQAERLHPEDVWAEITRRLTGQAGRPGAFAGAHVCPEETSDIPDLDEARLVILHPRVTHARNALDSTAMKFAHQATTTRGTANRAHRNMLVFLAADEARMNELDAAVRNYLGWSDVLANATDLDLTENQRTQAADKKRQESDTVESRLLGAYHWALVPHQPDPAAPFTIKPVKAEGQASSLGERVSKRLIIDGELHSEQATPPIRHALDTMVPKLWADGHVSVGELWQVYADYPYMSRLRDQSVLIDGLGRNSLAWQIDGLALAEGFEAESGQYLGLKLPGEEPVIIPTNSTLIVKPAAALAQRGNEMSERPGQAPGLGHGIEGREDDTSGPDLDPEERSTRPPSTRYFGTRTLNPERYTLDFKKLADEILVHLSKPGISLSVRVEIEATTPTGFDDNTVRTVSENSTTLKFEQAGFEEH